MKKLSLFTILTLLLLVLTTSCNKDIKSEATITYWTQTDTIIVTDTLDIDKAARIDSVLYAAGYVRHAWQETASKDDISDINYAVALCNEQASATFRKNIQSLTYDSFKETWKKTFPTDTLYPAPFTTSFSIMTSNSNYPIETNITYEVK